MAWLWAGLLPPAELAAARRCPARGTGRGTFILVTEDQPAFFQIVGRHFDRDPIACQRLDPVLLHLAGGVGNNLVPGVELHAVARVGEDFGHQSFELDQLFFSHICLQIDRRSARSLGAVGLGIRTAFAMQKRNPLHPFGLAAGLRRRTDRFLPAGLVAVGLWRATITTGTTVSARAFRAGGGFIVPARMHAWSGPCAAMLRRRRCGFAMARGAVIFSRQGNADQLL